MIVITRDANWERLMQALSLRGGWAFESRQELSSLGEASRDRVLVIVDGASFGGAQAHGVVGLRALYASAAIVLALTAEEMSPGSMNEALASGADEVLGKDWPEAKIFARLTAVCDRALASEVRTSADGGLKAERRSHRAYVLARGRWKDLGLSPAEFALLWRLLAREGQAVSREELLAALKSALNRDFEAETVARRALSLRKALSSWKGELESVRGGFYRLVSAR